MQSEDPRSGGMRLTVDDSVDHLNPNKRVRPQSMYQFKPQSTDQKNIRTTSTNNNNNNIIIRESLGSNLYRKLLINQSLDDQDGDNELRKQQSLIREKNINNNNNNNNNSSNMDSNSGLGWFWRKSGLLGNWMNKQPGKTGMEPFSPTSLGEECDKCARILYTFTRPGMDPKNLLNSNTSDHHKTRDMIKMIPSELIQTAKGLVIFTVFRTTPGPGSATSGSGIVIARDSPTSWGPPSGILIDSISLLEFLVGVDVYDVVLVLKTDEAVLSFGKPKVTLGSELSFAAGPLGNLGSESDLEEIPVFAYVRSKNIYGGLQLNDTVILERCEENARFYSRKIKAEQILSGGAVVVPGPAFGLINLIEAAEGKLADPDEFPENVNLSPSDQSRGVLNLAESRIRLKEEYGIDSTEQEDDHQRLQKKKLSEAERLLRRRTLPPLSYRSTSPPSEVSRKIRIGSKFAITEERGEFARSSTYRPPPSSSSSSGQDTPPVPPPRSSARKTSSSTAPTTLQQQYSPHMSTENLTGSYDQIRIGSVRKDRDLRRSLYEPISSEADQRGLVFSPVEKAPEPFQLHSRAGSQASNF
ncbi:hypothetical protein BY996DRAFT_7701766 [Phakopsora pachyrhizi]|nr:hypothetical protein BY996DRAFT_7701766 [Phakopsora pachyrhizi]